MIKFLDGTNTISNHMRQATKGRSIWSSDFAEAFSSSRKHKNEESNFALGIAAVMIIVLLAFISSDAYIEMRQSEEFELIKEPITD